MKKVSSVARIVALSISSAVALSSGVVLAHGGPGCDGKQGAQFEKMDGNADGKVTAAELTQHKQQWFADADGNKDGVLVGAELEAARAAKHGARREQMFSKQDANQDGKLSANEFRGSAAHFARADANQDGALTPAELAAAWQEKRKGGTGRWLKHLDQNGDAKITKDEVTNSASRMIERLDANKDGSLTREELARRGGKGGGRHHGKDAPPKAGQTRS